MDKDKPKEQLLNELEEMRHRIKELEASEAERKRIEQDLEERLKELGCFYSIASIAERPQTTLAEFYQEAANLLPDAWQYPDITCARVIINNNKFETENWREAEWKLISDIRVHGAKAGAVEICYLEGRPPVGEGPFHIEERHLIDAVAERLGRITERIQAEEALQESEERYRDLFENANDLVQCIAPDGHFLYVNKVWQQILEYSEEEVANLTLWDIIHPDSIPHCREMFQKVMSGEAVSNVEAIFVTKDGKPVAVEGNINRRCKEGEVVSTRGIFRNITERKKMEEALRESKAQLQALLDGSPDRIRQVDRNLRIIWANKAALDKHPDAIGQTCYKVYQNRDEPCEGCPCKRSLDTGLIETGVMCQPAGKGTQGEEYWEDIGVPLKDDKGEVVGAIQIARNVTERRQAEGKHRTIVKAALDGFWSTDLGGRLIDVNDSYCKMIGYTREELLTMSIPDIEAAENPEETAQHIKTIMEQGYDRFETRHKRKDGRIIDVEVSVNYLDVAGGQMFGFVRDITERKQLEEARMEQAMALARTEEVQQSRQRIIAMQESLRKNIAQEIHGSVQNRLIILMHRLADLERSSLSEQMAEEIADLRQKLGEVLEDHIRPVSQRLFPSILRRGLVPTLQSLVDQFEKAQSIDMELSEELKRQERVNPRFITEQVRLVAYRIAEEALTNAAKHAKASRVTVKLELSSEDWLHLMVRDDGQGFEVGSASAGLGILLMQDYAEVVGGCCVINSTPGKGTKVTAAVPLAEPGAEYPERA